MRAIVSARLRAAVLSVITIGALAPAVATAPAKASTASADSAGSPVPSTSSAAAQAAPSTSVVTLLTGDRVLTRHDERGRTITSVLPGSPHFGKPFQLVNVGRHSWFMPRLRPSQRMRLDRSVFDVSTLALHRRVSLSITFDRGATVRSLPGVRMRTATARVNASGRTTVLGTYDARRPLPSGLWSSLRGVSRIAVAGAVAPATPSPSPQMRILTLNLTQADGQPIAQTDIWVFSMDDGRLLDAQPEIVDGQWKVSVFPGHYLVWVDDVASDREVFRQVTVDDADTSVDISQSEATVRPSIELPRLASLSPMVMVTGWDAGHRVGFSIGWGGQLPRLSPMPAVPVGQIATEVSNLWGPQGYRPVAGGITHPLVSATAAEFVRPGIPANLSFHPGLGNAVSLTVRNAATGKPQLGGNSWIASTPYDVYGFAQQFPTRRPGVVQVRLLGDPDLTWQTESDATFQWDGIHTGEIFERRHYRPGQHAHVTFWKAPFTPMGDVGDEEANLRTDPLPYMARCVLCVVDGRLQGLASMVSSAGSHQFGFSHNGTWALYRGPQRIAATGDQPLEAIGPSVSVSGGEQLRLSARLKPFGADQRLSTHVRDAWTFAVPTTQPNVVPILRASYVPPTDLRSVGKVGRVSFPITFDNLGPVDDRVATASVRWSVDGRHWHAASLERQDENTFTVSYVNPRASVSRPYLSLRVAARDIAGRTIHESVEHAYYLPRAGRLPFVHATVPPPPVVRPDRFRPRSLCGTPTRTRYACQARLGGSTLRAGRASTTPHGLGADQLRSAYGLGDDSAPSTVAVIAAFDDPSAESDMNHYRAQYGLPACTTASGCFTKLNQSGEKGPYPMPEYGWGVETSLDLDMVSAACPTCHVVLVEADVPDQESLVRAEQTAVAAGATVVNHSFGRYEGTGDETVGPSFVHPGVTSVVASGDEGFGPALFPASVPDVVAVGGTVLTPTTADPRGWTERAWALASSGCSAYFPKATGQVDTVCRNRTISDVSAVASGLAVYDTFLPRKYHPGWLKVGGTSASSPLVAGMIASVGAGGLRPAQLYAHASSFHDIVTGSNGFCRDTYLCEAGVGYDGPTGLGSPTSAGAFANLH